MGNWFESLAEGWPAPEDGYAVGEIWGNVDEAWLYADAAIKVWLAARLAPGWPERVRLLGATTRAVAAMLDWLNDEFEFPVDTVPDVVGPLSRVGTLDDIPPRADAMDVLEHLGALHHVVAAKSSLARAWLQIADVDRRSEDTWRGKTTMALVEAIDRAYSAFRMLGPFSMPPGAGEAITSEVDWVA